LKNLRLTLDMMDLLHYPRNRRAVIFNRVDSKAGFSQEEAEEALKMPITTRVPASRDVPASINRGVPITVARKDHPVSAAIFEFAATVIAPERAGGRKGRRLLGRRAK
jgi:pilus assembly protein CpaE